MNREEILNKAQKENKIADEYQVDVLKNANLVALILLIAIIGIMLMFSIIQMFQGKVPFANPFIFVFLLAFVLTFQSFVVYCGNKKKIELLKSIVGLVVAVYSLISFI